MPSPKVREELPDGELSGFFIVRSQLTEFDKPITIPLSYEVDNEPADCELGTDSETRLSNSSHPKEWH
ncbi:hypothetical protein RCL_jg3455.t1 [Rhizophagus clarus]|uniref:Uncharacterized protein n=1 Tax=Rhizophagus clarus TaxID=94130 RepID=A0A8H3MAL9_9GLOM|nr:hypothetical protein RCL_jg3455.t1 [Rhizophagus clarus]